MARSEETRTALLDAAERLFAELGISGASDRKVAEAAGQRNHSAVAYYFGGRDGLLTALVERHTASLEDGRRRHFETSDSLLGDVRSLVLPITEALALLPTPSWRAQFLARSLHHQDTRPLLRGALDKTPTALAIGQSLAERLGHLEPEIIRARVNLMMRTAVVTCADVERAALEGRRPAQWESTGIFLSDALAGMVAAPSTLPGTGAGTRRASDAGEVAGASQAPDPDSDEAGETAAPARSV